jgi:high affinity Mn2+ porin
LANNTACIAVATAKEIGNQSTAPRITSNADIDSTISGGVSLTGKQWGRSDDTVGIAGALNGISAGHAAFLNDGGLGILVGDGKLPHPGPEQIIETYYKFSLDPWSVTLDYQFIGNPAYNRDRGPASVFGLRLHAQF